jgi:hypothetical protein
MGNKKYLRHYHLVELKVSKSAYSLDEMKRQLISHCRFHAMFWVSAEKLEYFVSDNWIPFCKEMIRSIRINSRNHFFLGFLEEMASYDEDEIRELVARCDYTPLSAIEKLCDDPVFLVRYTAQNKRIYMKMVKRNFPKNMSATDFLNWVNSAPIEELESFSNKEFEEITVSRHTPRIKISRTTVFTIILSAIAACFISYQAALYGLLLYVLMSYIERQARDH